MVDGNITKLNNIIESITWWNFLESSILGLLVGAISSLIASRIFLHYTNNRLPIIKKSTDLIYEESGDKNYILLKFLNLSKHSIIDIRISLYGVNYQNDEHTLSSLDKLSSKKIEYVKNYDKNDEDDLDYAIVVGLEVPSLESVKNYHDISIQFIARESYFNTFITLETIYSPTKIKTDNVFEIGKHLSYRTTR